MGPISSTEKPARNYHNTQHNNAEKHKSQHHYFGGWVGSTPGIDLLAKRKPVPDENIIKVKGYYFYIRFIILRINTENLSLERQMDTLLTFREYTPKLK
jgi:hypothetical protein